MAEDYRVFFLINRHAAEPGVPGYSLIPGPSRYRNPFGMEDEAYADFADTNCLSLVKENDKVMVSRTFSKSAKARTESRTFSISLSL